MAMDGVVLVVTVPATELELKMAFSSDCDAEAARGRTMEQVLKYVVDKSEVISPAWHTCHSTGYKQVSFSVESGTDSDIIMKQLVDAKIGAKYNSTISVLPCLAFFDSEAPQSNTLLQGTMKDLCRGHSEWHHHFVKERLTLPETMEEVKKQSEFTFDFLILLLIAGMVAALGLMADSIMILVASMLISPLMGPVTATAFGVRTRVSQLIKMGIMNQMVGLLFCVIEGFLCGLIIPLSKEHFGLKQWPTEEMISRGELCSIWMSMVVAALSGVAVAISQLTNNTNSLVGVAISSSLLPPAVNAGLFWASTCTYSIYGESPVIKGHFKYTNDSVTELGVLGSISLGMTFINVLFIFVSAAVVLKIKVAASHNPAEHKFKKRNMQLFGDNMSTLISQDMPENMEKRSPSNSTLRNDPENLPKKLKCPSTENELSQFNNCKNMEMEI